MYMPKYSEYTLLELHEELKSLNSEKYPDRPEIIEREFEVRSEAGDVVLDTKHSEFFPAEIPLALGFRAFWCFSGEALWPPSLLH